MVIQNCRDSINHVVRNRGVHVSGKVDEAGGKVIFPRFPGKVIGIDWDAVSTQTRPWVKRRIAEWLCRRGINDLPYVDSHSISEDLQFVDKRNVHRPVNVLK